MQLQTSQAVPRCLALRLSGRRSISSVRTERRPRAVLTLFLRAPDCVLKRWLAASAKTRGSGQDAGSTATALALLAKLRKEQPEEALLKEFDENEVHMQRILAEAPIAERIQLVEALAHLGSVQGRPYAISPLLLRFLEVYIELVPELGEEEQIGDRADRLRRVLCAFNRADVRTERVRMLYDHIERDFPRFESSGDLLAMPQAVRLCHTMLATSQSAAAAVIVLLQCALREPLMNYSDDSVELRLLKMIEMLIRVDNLHTQTLLPPEVVEYLSVVRKLRYYDRALRRDTALSYQLAFFLLKHGFPAKRLMMGPYALKVCDPEKRINFEPLEERVFRTRMADSDDPPARKKRHLEKNGWSCFDVPAATWHGMGSYEAKASYVRGLLKNADLLAP